MLHKPFGKTNNRSTSAGISAIKKIKLDGTRSKTTRVPSNWAVESSIIGFFERQIRFPYCRACVWNANNPERFAMLLPMLQECSALFKRHIPDRHAVQSSYVERTHKDFVIPRTVYTTVTINKNFRTAAHKDAGDLAAGFSNMLVLSQGSFLGGNLVLPDWRLGVKLEHGDLVMFDAHEFHGNTQIIPIGKAKRISLVLYYREKMQYCKSTAAELAFAKNRKPGDPVFPEEK